LQNIDKQLINCYHKLVTLPCSSPSIWGARVFGLNEMKSSRSVGSFESLSVRMIPHLRNRIEMLVTLSDMSLRIPKLREYRDACHIECLSEFTKLKRIEM